MPAEKRGRLVLEIESSMFVLKAIRTIVRTMAERIASAGDITIVNDKLIEKVAEGAPFPD